MEACGKKGPPLVPFSNLPAAVTAFTAKRVGTQVVLRFTVPTTNIDRRQPADLDRVELYAHPTRLLRPADYLRRGTIVGSVKVRRPAAAGENGAPSPPLEAGVDQGAVATIVNTPDVSGPPPEAPTPSREIDPENRPLFPGGGGPLLSPRQPMFAMRYYIAVGVNRGGRNGAPSPVVEVPLVAPPAPPAKVDVSYTEKSLSISWAPPAVPLARPLQESSPQGRALPSRPVVSFSGSSGYNVYEVPLPAASGDAAAAPVLAALNRALLTATQLEDSRIEFGTERCFVVRSQETLGAVTIESEPSQMACVTPVDTFAPPPPHSVGAVASEGAISLIWEPSNDADLAGYLVLRGEAPGEKLQALTAGPIADTTYRDTTVKSGVAYVYAVVAVDKANNISAQSNRVPERAR